VKRATTAGAALVLVAAWLLFRSGTPFAPPDRGAPGITFLVPDDYTVLDVGESTLGAAAGALMEALDAGDRVAARFTRSGDRIQLLADANHDMIDQRVLGREGTVRRILWRGPVRKRLSWAEANGDLAVPGLPPPEYRNPYH
jgi:hypothetical protein